VVSRLHSALTFHWASSDLKDVLAKKCHYEMLNEHYYALPQTTLTDVLGAF